MHEFGQCEQSTVMRHGSRIASILSDQQSKRRSSRFDIAQSLSDLMGEAVKSGRPLHEVACLVHDYVFRMEYSAMTVFNAAQGDGDPGESITAAD